MEENCIDAVCVLEKNEMKGVVLFHQCRGNRYTIVDIRFSNMKPNSTHAIHIHEKGDLRNGCESLGGHWNPENTTHGSIKVPSRPRHAGDLINNITTDKNGNFHYRYKDPLIRLNGTKSIIGRSVVVHRGKDDLGLGGNKESLATGNAGSRLMCGVIGLA